MAVSAIGLIFYLLVYLFAGLVLYWVIRLAVRHAIADADRRRNRTGSDAP